MSSEVNFQVPEDSRREVTFRTVKGTFPSVRFLFISVFLCFIGLQIVENIRE